MPKPNENLNNQLREELDDLIGNFEPGKSPDDDREENVEEEILADEVGEEEGTSGDEDLTGDENFEEEEVEAGETEEVTSEPDETPDISQELITLKEQNDRLLEQLNKMSSEREVIPTKADTPEPEPKEAEAPDFVGELDLDTLAMDKNVLNTVLNGVVQTAVTRAVEKMLVNVPQVVQTQVKYYKVLTDAVDDFYKQNEDLVPARQVVRMVTNEVVAEHPDWELPKVLDEAATKTRKLLGVVKQTTGNQEMTPGGRKPALPKKTSTRKAVKKPKLSKLEQEIAELL